MRTWMLILCLGVIVGVQGETCISSRCSGSPLTSASPPPAQQQRSTTSLAVCGAHTKWCAAGRNSPADLTQQALPAQQRVSTLCLSHTNNAAAQPSQYGEYQGDYGGSSYGKKDYKHAEKHEHKHEECTCVGYPGHDGAPGPPGEKGDDGPPGAYMLRARRGS